MDDPMQIELIDTFLDVIATRNFGRSAERLGVTQPTVSGRIRALETAVGVRLFDRSRAGTTLTAEGALFEPHARSLAHDWREALRRTQGGVRPVMRIGIQNDLAGAGIGGLVAGFSRAAPGAAFYIEPDYSNQMCADLLAGTLDLAVMYSPRPHPDLHFQSVGEVTYRMISGRPTTMAGLDPATYIFTHFSTAFEATHRQILPRMVQARLSVGQSRTVEALLRAQGGAGYVLEPAAGDMVAREGYLVVPDAPVMPQPVYIAVHVRNRIAPLTAALARAVRTALFA
jgi:LysR family transcriptional regulator, flagellar master operon regulator